MKNMKTRVNNLTSSAMALCIAFISFGCQKSNDPGTSAENLAATKLKTVIEATCTVQGWASQNGGTTGGGTAAPTVVTNYADLKAAILNVNVKVVQVNGTITIPLGGRISFQDQTGKTIFGSAGAKLISNDQTKANSGIINVKRCTNIMIRNLIFEGPGAYDVDGWDNAIIDASTNVWVDHCEFRDGVDGNFDIKNVSDYITVSNCKFAYLKPPRAGGSGGSDDHRFSGLIGSSDSATADRNRLRVTFVRCWWAEGCVARMPRVRFGKIHLVNNYFNSTVSKSCIQAGFEANILAEANVFENVKNPVDLMDNKSTAVQLKDNIFTTVTGNISGNGNTAFTPPYNISPLNSSSVKATVTSSGGAGATLTGNNCS